MAWGTDRTDRLSERHTPLTSGSTAGRGCVESFNARLRDERLNGEVFHSPRDAEIVIEGRRRHNTVQPHPALRWTPPAPEVRLPKPQA
jgi:transposase InsO family protein